MTDLVSIIIPVHNGAASISGCLQAALASNYVRFEVIVVDDGSEDDTVAIVKAFPCSLVQLPVNCGASSARNIGARHSHGDILFFTDADCLLEPQSLSRAVTRLKAAGRDTLLGGTYTLQPADKRFLSHFQSVFVHYAESRERDNPDYIATHAMALYADTFQRSGGFCEDFLPILEDVEFSHRLRRSGHRLLMDPTIQVRHQFDYSLLRSIRNGFRKSRYWTIYSLHNRDLLADSGTASRALKLSVAALFGSLASGLLLLTSGDLRLGAIMALLMALSISVNRRLLQGFFRLRGPAFALPACAYYLLLYPLVVGCGGLAGLISYRRYARLLEDVA